MQEKSSDRHIYIPGVQQPIFHFNFSLNIPNKTVDFDYIDKLFNSIFTLDCSELSLDRSLKVYPALIARYLLLANSIQSYIGIPSFDNGKILKTEIKPFSDNELQLSFEAYVPYIKYVSLDLRIKVYQLCIPIIVLIIQKKISELNVLMENMHKDLAHYRRLTQQGSSTIPLLKAAFDSNIPFIQLEQKVYQLGWGHKSKLILASTVEEDSYIGSRLAHDKISTINILRDSGFPVAQSHYIHDKKDLLLYAENIGWPVIVKPINRDRSEGVTTNISNLDMLEQAYDYALKKSKKIMIEKHIIGDVYRIGLINNNVLLVSRRLPKGVYGNGTSTIEELIDTFNQTEVKKAPWLRSKPVPKDELALKILQKQSYQLGTILQDGVFANVRIIQSDEEGGTPGDFTDKVHPENVMLAQRISKLFQLQSIGIDIISKDIEKPWYENDAKILEVNFTPAIANPQEPWKTKRSKHFIENYMPKDARIPITIFIGTDKAWDDGWSFYQSINKNGIQAFIVNHESVYNHEKSELKFTLNDFNSRCHALLRDRDMEHMVVVMQTNELVVQGIPFDQITKLVVSETKLNDFKTNVSLSEKHTLELIKYLRRFLTVYR